MERRKKRIKKEKSAGAVIFRKGGGKTYYLLLHYAGGHWDFPKGHIESGENEKETVLREVEEETGIKEINFIEAPKEKITYFFKKTYSYKSKAPFVFKEVIFYLAETREKTVKISYEHEGFKWLPYKQAVERVTYKNAKNILKKANEFLKQKKYA